MKEIFMIISLHFLPPENRNELQAASFKLTACGLRLEACSSYYQTVKKIAVLQKTFQEKETDSPKSNNFKNL